MLGAKMQPNHQRSCLAFLLKFLNFLQSFIGVSIIIYSLWMLNHWKKHAWIPQPSAPSPESSVRFLLPGHDLPLNRMVNMVSGIEDGIAFSFRNLPSPWFIYTSLGIGFILCSITCIGHIAAEVVNGWCLCFYTLLTAMLMIVEAAFVGFIMLDRQWEKALSLLLAMILRAMVSTRRGEDDSSDDDYTIIRRGTWPPLLNPNSMQTLGSTSADGKTVHSDIWST